MRHISSLSNRWLMLFPNHLLFSFSFPWLMCVYVVSIHCAAFVYISKSGLNIGRKGKGNQHDRWFCVSGKLIHASIQYKKNNKYHSSRLCHFVGGQSRYVRVKTLLTPFRSNTPVFTSAIPLVSHSSRKEYLACQMLTGFIALSAHNFKLRPWVRKLNTHYLKAKIQSKLDC